MRWTIKQARLFVRWCERIRELYPELPDEAVEKQASNLTKQGIQVQ